ncbi:VCBS repeat-containing protein [Actinocorallia sp. A-T 12471]|uniref:FG-GAP repeat domain-containing protein n=1 Tax=Actinocorallia sp. A-T 12471 TaxID=3089813 RepID=UPI0029CD4A58|nr:VCBS repeat-containing protein [Actinocorallia sp. A-T 12471]MDX6743638.1 VCBS repeat-containing protein [Actinocorallia sp. A-T 12471]
MKRVIGAAAGAALVAAAFLLPTTAARAADCSSAVLSDFDGDGNADYVVGDPGAGVGYEAGAGHVTVIYGDGALGVAERDSLTADSPQAGAGFGHAVATADLDGDGCTDLVVGAPWADGGVGNAEIFLGSPDGLTRERVLKPEGTSRTFGFSVAARAGHGDHTATVAIGAPHETVKELESAGAVHLFFANGDDAPGYRHVTQDDKQAEGVAEAGDLFGYAVALGAIMGDKDAPDLIVSEPGEDVDGQAVDAGSFSVVEDVTAQGTAKGQHWHYGNLGIGDPSEGGRIGWSLAYAEDGDTVYVAAGVPGQTVGGKARVGVVAVLSSTGNGLEPLEAAAQSTSAVPYAEAEDQYGWSVALAGGETTDGHGPVLAVGVPYDESEDSVPDHGWVHLVPLSDRASSLLVDALNVQSEMPGDPGPYDMFGRAVGFTKGAVLIGVPDDQEKPGGSVMVKPFDGGESAFLLPDSDCDEADFGAAFA